MAETNIAAMEEGRWRLVRDPFGGLTDDRLLVRSLRDIEVGQIKEIVADLQLRTDAKNPARREKNFVDDPNADGIHKGRYRNVRTVGYARGDTGRSGLIVQVLALGFVQKYGDLGPAYLVNTRDRLISPFAKLATAEKDVREIKYKGIDPAKAGEIKDKISLTAGVVEAQVRILEDGSANIHVLTETNTWVTATKASATEDTITKNLITGDIVLTKEWNNITQASVDAILSDLPTATSGYAIGTAVGTDNLDGSGKVRLTQNKITSISTIDDLPDPLITDDNEILEPFGLKSGEEDAIAYVFSGLNPASRATCRGLSDAALVTAYPGAGWTYIKRRFRALDDGTATFTVLFHKVVWNAFDVDVPDITTYENKETEHERINEYWFRVNNSEDLDDTANNNSIYDDNLLPDYNVMSVRVRENRDGSLTVQRTQWHEAKGESGSELEQAEAKKLYPHSGWSGTLNRFIIINENLKDKTTAYATPADSSGYTLVDTREEFREGLWNKYYIYEKMTWNSGVADSDAMMLEVSKLTTGIRYIRRIWPRRTSAARTTLTTTGGKAINNYEYDSVTYVHAHVLIQDHGDSAFSVTQTLYHPNDILGPTTPRKESLWEGVTEESAYRTNASNNLTKEFYYHKYLAVKATLRQAWQFIEDQDGKNMGIERGSASVRKLGTGRYFATCLVLVSIGDWA